MKLIKDAGVPSSSNGDLKEWELKRDPDTCINGGKNGRRFYLKKILSEGESAH